MVAENTNLTNQQVTQWFCAALNAGCVMLTRRGGIHSGCATFAISLALALTSLPLWARPHAHQSP